MRKKIGFLRPVSVIFLPVVMLVSSLSLPVSGALALTPDPWSIMGFTAGKAAVERQWETLFQSIPNPTVAQAHSLAITNRPNMYTTAGNLQGLEYEVEQLRSYGLDPQVVTYYPYASLPGTVSVEMVAPTQLLLKNKEDGFPWQENWDQVAIGFNAYSPDGEATAEVVYANYGGAADYDKLEQMGVDVKGKIVIVRYGGGPARGAKQAQAALHGAAGVLLYDDPVEDGCILGPVYPTGPWRPPDSFQRGSVQYIWEYPGDPLTPGWAATENAHRLPVDQAPQLPTGAPVTPLGYGDVSILLAALDGPVAPADWQGGLRDARCAIPGVTPVPVYRVGPGPTKVHMKVNLQNGIKPIKDVFIKFPGSKYPDQMVVLAGHRDGWVYGTRDSVSGFISIMENGPGVR